MSQNDFDLTTADANTGPTVRAGMNAMAQALATCSSGATEPSTMYAYQFWADTTSGYMKQRNAANNAWITRWQLSAGQLAALSGATFTGLVNFAAGADIASAATINLTAATGNSPRITGTTPTSAVTMNTGQWELVVADAAWPLTYHATANKLNTGGSNYTCVAGDMVLYHKDSSGVVHGTIYPVSGEPLVPRSSSPATAVGYSPGAGGTVVQATSKSTAVTLNKPCGQITLNNAALAGGATVAFAINNSVVSIGDTVSLSLAAGTFITSGDYLVWPDAVGDGVFFISVKNNTGGSLSNALGINFAIISGVSA